MKRSALFSVLCAAMALLPASLEAKEPPKQFGGVASDTMPVPRMKPNESDAVLARRIDLPTGKSIMIDLPRDAGEIFIADPKVANAVIRNMRKIFLIGMAEGTTSIFVMDKSGAQIAALDVAVSKELARQLSVLRDVLKKAMPKAEIEVASVGDNFILSGTVDSGLEAQNAVDIATNLVGQTGVAGALTVGKVINAMQVRGRDQVMLKVTIAEVQRTVLKQLGINFEGQWSVANSVLDLTSQNPFSIQQAALSPTGITAAIGNKSATLKTLERQGLLRTLAEPTLTAISGESAKFLAGGEVSVPQSQICDATNRNCTTTIAFKPVGVSLSFTPTVLSENRISIRLATDVTEVDPSNATGVGFRTRKVETTVELPSGGVMATAGLIQQINRQQINGFPGLMNIPVLGTLFRSRDFQRNETELVILVQPFIARPSSAGAIARPGDGLSDPSDPSTIFMGRLNKTFGSAVGGAQHGPVGFINE